MEDAHRPSAQLNSAPSPRLLLLEFWGLGDLTLATTFIHAAATQYEVTIAGKPHARPLLSPTFPELRFIEYDPPWTAFRGKYKVRQWDWHRLRETLTIFRQAHFAAAVSVRHDPRDHFLMWCAAAKRRVGFPTKGSGVFLTDRVCLADTKSHRVERWRALGKALDLPQMDRAEPRLAHANYRSARIDRLFAGIRQPVLCLHTGARLRTRRWPEESFAALLEKLRASFQFHVVLVPDPDGFGAVLERFVDTTLRDLSIGELVDLLGRIDLLIGNDSAPAHIAAACGRPVFAIFGPTDPDWFHPWGNRENMIIRDICPWRPCFDYCKFREPHCLTKLAPDAAWRDIESRMEALIAAGLLPAAVRKETFVRSAQ
jgi:ADP-heptose:LPS heptosyltransferase